MTRGKDDTDFKSRWSRLKREASEPSEEVAADVKAETEALGDLSDEEVLEELGLPDPDSLKPGDNFSVFMAKAVPQRIRNRALRRLWISDPVLANLDELLDYGEDFTDAANVVENLQTAYQVGKGFVDRVAEATKADVATAVDPPDEPAGEITGVSDDAPVETPPNTDVQTVADDDDLVGSAESYAPGESGEKTAKFADVKRGIQTRPRMRFRVVE